MLKVLFSNFSDNAALGEYADRILHKHLSSKSPLLCQLKKPQIWYWNRRTVAASVLIGLFIAMIPIPMQMLVAAFCAVVFNANLPLAIALVWLSNPVTILPLAWMCLNVGCGLLGVNMQVISLMSAGNFQQLFAAYWLPFVVGCLTTGLILGLAGYYLTFILWRANIIHRLNQRKDKTLKDKELKS